MTNSKRFPWVLAVVTAILFLRGVYGAAQEPPTTRELLNAAHKTADLTGLGPYTLTASVTVDSGDKKTRKTGRLTISRDSGRVREELEIGGTREVRVFLGAKQYVVPGQGLLSGLELKDFDQSWDPLRCSGRLVFPGFKAVRRDKVEGADAWCMSKDSEQREPSACFDAAQGVFLREISKEQISTRFFDFIPVEDKLLYPRRALILKENLERIEVDSIEVKHAAALDDLFTPPDNAIEIEACLSPSSPKFPSFPKVVYAPEPEFPEQERKQMKQGIVSMSVIVDQEGNVAAAQVLKAPTEGFARKAIETVRKWRFRPAMCGERAVGAEMDVEVDFHRY
jgi:TonB family protein